jgi:hypothetical protein
VPRKRIPFEVLLALQNQLDALSPRNAQRKDLVEEACEAFGVSASTVRRQLRTHQLPYLTHRSDYNKSRSLPETDMRRYCELIAALKLRTTSKKGRRLSTKACIGVLEKSGIETEEGLVKVESGLLKLSTVSRYLKQWGYDNRTLSIEPPWTPFQATFSNECWQFDFSPSDLKKPEFFGKTLKEGPEYLALAGVTDDRSGVCYQEYHVVKGEDAMTALLFLFNAMSAKKDKNNPFQGIPSVIYMDAGPVSKSRVFLWVMKQLGIEVRVHMPRGSDGRRTTSRSKGKVERSFLTIKSSLETLYHLQQPETLEEANTWLHRYLEEYNAMDHRYEDHSRMEDWLQNLPSQGFREMCSWDRFRTFAREPEQRKADSNACVGIDGIRYQLSHDMAGQDITLLWGLFDNELYVEFNDEKQGPFYPEEGPIPFGKFRKHKKSSVELKADRIGELAKTISLPRSALSGINGSDQALLAQANIVQMEKPKSMPFDDSPFLQPTTFKNKLDAKTAIADYLGKPLSRLTDLQIAAINTILDETLDKKTVLDKIRAYFTLSSTGLREVTDVR